MAVEDGADFYRRILDNVYDGVYLLDRDRRITYWNRGAERIAGYTAGEVVGTHCRDNVLMHIDGLGNRLCHSDACPVVSCIEAGEPREAEAYLRHKDGYRVPILIHTAPLFEDGGRITGAVEVFTDNSSVVDARQQIKKLESLALLDPLTGLGNRRHAEIHLRARLDQLVRYGWPFSLLYYDIDFFKRVNDTYGHDVGDEVLKVVARSTEGGMRSFDVVSRWGGEEFTAIIENVDEKHLRGIAEKARALVEHSSIRRGGETISVTISVGATEASSDDSIETLVKRADQLMYESKEAGRNRVTTG